MQFLDHRILGIELGFLLGHALCSAPLLLLHLFCSVLLRLSPLLYRSSFFRLASSSFSIFCSFTFPSLTLYTYLSQIFLLLLSLAFSLFFFFFSFYLFGLLSCSFSFFGVKILSSFTMPSSLGKRSVHYCISLGKPSPRPCIVCSRSAHNRCGAGTNLALL